MDKQEFRIYKISRMFHIYQEAVFVKRSYIPHDYERSTWQDSDKVEVTLHVNKQIIGSFFELINHDKIRKLDSELFEVLYTIHDNKFGYNKILGYGNLVKIISPNLFVRNYLKYLEEIKKMY